MMLRSGNDAALAVAEHVGGTVENFVKMMNDKARSWDLKIRRLKHLMAGCGRPLLHGLRAGHAHPVCFTESCFCPNCGNQEYDNHQPQLIYNKRNAFSVSRCGRGKDRIYGKGRKMPCDIGNKGWI